MRLLARICIHTTRESFVNPMSDKVQLHIYGNLLLCAACRNFLPRMACQPSRINMERKSKETRHGAAGLRQSLESSRDAQEITWNITDCPSLINVRGIYSTITPLTSVVGQCSRRREVSKNLPHRIATDTGQSSFLPCESQNSLSTGVGSWVYLPPPILGRIVMIFVLERERGSV